MKKNNLFTKVTLAALFVLSAVAFSSCKADPEEEYIPSVTDLVKLSDYDLLIGNWTSGYGESFSIGTQSFSSDSYAINNTYVYKASKTSGFIYGKYTEIYDWTKETTEEPENKNGWLEYWGKWYPTNYDLLGKWYAIYYDKLSATSVELSGAYKFDGKEACDTLEEALEEFTIGNGYFAGNSSCTKN